MMLSSCQSGLRMEESRDPWTLTRIDRHCRYKTADIERDVAALTHSAVKDGPAALRPFEGEAGVALAQTCEELYATFGEEWPEQERDLLARRATTRLSGQSAIKSLTHGCGRRVF
jgi:hypothetical protein